MLLRRLQTRMSEIWEAFEHKFLRRLASIGSYEDPRSCNHEWHVVSTIIADVDLLLECYKCCSYGVVEDPHEREWSEAFSAPEKSYRWRDNSRVKRGKQFDL